ncbi:MAG: hypothetical protein U9N19_03225 [Thermodesulfobacteriota bacterium]|nr:hypothetical protein [Thermodesulfobacteriota bacterium]
MFKKLAIISIIASIFYMPLFFTSCSKSKPPRPGPNFVWVVPHTTPDGEKIPEHWKHKSCSKPGAVWVPGHLNPSGRWISGHWK